MEGNYRGQIQDISRDIHVRIRLKSRNDSGIRCEPVEFRADDLPNVSQQRYR